MQSVSLLYKHEYDINDKIKINIPTVGEVIDNEDAYYSLVSMCVSMPIDYMVPLDDMGIDFTEITEYDLFIILFQHMGSLGIENTKLVFGDMDLSKFHLAKNEANEEVVLYNPDTDTVIDRVVQAQISHLMLKISGLAQDKRKPANEEAKSYMLERARKKMKRNNNRNRESQLETLIVAMVNAPEFKYDFDSVRNMSIYQFNESVRQVLKRVDVGWKMHGIYSGTVDVKSINKDELNWLVHK